MGIKYESSGDDFNWQYSVHSKHMRRRTADLPQIQSGEKGYFVVLGLAAQ